MGRGASCTRPSPGTAPWCWTSTRPTARHAPSRASPPARFPPSATACRCGSRRERGSAAMSESASVAAWLAAPFWNPAERRLRAFWRLLGFALLVGGLSKIALAAGLVNRGHEGLALLTVFLRLVLTMGALWLTARFLERRPLSDSG